MNGYTRYPKKIKLIIMNIYFNKGYSKSIILHTVRGSQHTYEAYTKSLKNSKITHSMSRQSKCPDKSPIEIF